MHYSGIKWIILLALSIIRISEKIIKFLKYKNKKYQKNIIKIH